MFVLSFGVVKELLKLGARIQLCGSTALVFGKEKGRYIVLNHDFVMFASTWSYIRWWFFSDLLLQPIAWFPPCCNRFKRWDVTGISRIGSRRNYRDNWHCSYWQGLWEFREEASISRSWCQKINPPCLSNGLAIFLSKLANQKLFYPL